MTTSQPQSDTRQTMPPQTPLTLIVATSRQPTSSLLGIGKNGTLPWPMLKTDMAFFARVTKRRGVLRPESAGATEGNGEGMKNAVVMGRKTWESIPVHLRPLKGRVNVVVSRSSGEGIMEEVNSKGDCDEVFVVKGVKEAVERLGGYYTAQNGGEGRGKDFWGKIWVIGGAEIYRAAIEDQDLREMGVPVRVVMTQVRKVSEDGGDGKEDSWECDTFFPVDVEKGEDGWRGVEPEEVGKWVGEEVSGEWVRDKSGKADLKFTGFEREL